MNVDGGLSRDGRKGARAAICRDEHRQYLGAFVIVMEGQTDPSCLEAAACNESFAFAQDLNIDYVKLASDCLHVVNNYHKKAFCPYIMILREMEHRT